MDFTITENIEYFTFNFNFEEFVVRQLKTALYFYSLGYFAINLFSIALIFYFDYCWRFALEIYHLKINSNFKFIIYSLISNNFHFVWR